jgi:hypothetical protein
MNSLQISSEVSFSSSIQLGRRIYFKDYNPTEFESPQDTVSHITIPCSVFERHSDEFKYQRIEKLSLFGSYGDAESCHLMSPEHCRKYPQSYEKYDKDPSNRLAMSRHLHGWYDGLSMSTSVFYLKYDCQSENQAVMGRFQVWFYVIAVDQEYANMIFNYLENYEVTDNPLMVRTSVHIISPKVFEVCMNWKEKEILKLWNSFFDMASAVP